MDARFFFLALFALLLALLFATDSAKELQQPMAVQGQLDLRDWNFEKDGNVELKGEWSFYWDKLLTPENLNADPLPVMTGFFKLPGFWNGYNVDGNSLKGDGFATLRLQVKLNPGDHSMAIRLEDQATAYRLWVNGKLFMTNGVVAQSHQGATPQYLVKISNIPLDSNSLDLILQISNFHLHRGGPYRTITLGTAPQVRKIQLLLWAVDLLTLALLLTVGLHHVSFYLLRRKELASLYFGLFCLLWGLHIPFWGAGGKFITVLLPQFNWEIAHKLDLLTWYLSVPILRMFIARLYPEESNQRKIGSSLILTLLDRKSMMQA